MPNLDVLRQADNGRVVKHLQGRQTVVNEPKASPRRDAKDYYSVLAACLRGREVNSVTYGADHAPLTLTLTGGLVFSFSTELQGGARRSSGTWQCANDAQMAVTLQDATRSVGADTVMTLLRSLPGFPKTHVPQALPVTATPLPQERFASKRYASGA